MNIKEILIKNEKEFRDKWGRFYYSDDVGMDWEKPKKQNVTGGIKDEHNGCCLASDDIEKDIGKAQLRLISAFKEMVEETETIDWAEVRFKTNILSSLTQIEIKNKKAILKTKLMSY